jgi:hypothetical protein
MSTAFPHARPTAHTARTTKVPQREPVHVLPSRLSMDSTYHYPVKLIFQAHLRMYSLIHTDSLAQPRKVLCFKVFAMYSQCMVFLHLNYIHKISLEKVQYNQQNNARTENNGESSSA